jgi:hypothetical protein
MHVLRPDSKEKLTMRKSLYPFTLLVLSAGLALAQSQSTSPQYPSGSPTTQPTTPEQRTPSATPPDTTGQQPDQTKPANPDQKSGQQSPGANLPQSDTSAASSVDLQTKLQSAIQQDPSLSSANISVSVEDKSIILGGTASDEAQKRNAEQIAKANAGGRKVKNHIKVSASDTSKTPSATAPPK